MTTEIPDAQTSTEPQPPPPAPAPLPSPGAMIREARERAHFSLEDMAAHTKLARSTLDALERDDYNALLEPVYVRGYYRKCAKVLEMDEERLIAAYGARVSPKTPEAPSKLRLASGTELGSSSRLPVSMAVLAAVVAIVACAFLWFARDRSDNYPPASSVAGTSEPAPAPGIPAEQVMVEPAAEAPEETGTDAETAAPAATEPAVTTSESPVPAVAVAPGTLRLQFTQTSWVRVDDGSGKTLINEMRRAGSQETFNGQLPLSVFLGNAPGVQVEYEGQSIDVKPYVRDNNTARFSVPQQ